MSKMSKKVLKWRRRQKKGAIMTPQKFAEIKSKAAAAGATNPEAVAGSAYWGTVLSKYRKSKRRKKAG